MTADQVPEKARNLEKSLTWGEAKEYAANIPEEKRKGGCGCYTVYVPCACLPCTPCWPSCPFNMCCCLWYNWFMCACPEDERNPPTRWGCSDMKGIYYSLLTVDSEKGSLGFWSNWGGNPPEDAEVGCYYIRCC